jgi:hypothetical protein
LKERSPEYRLTNARIEIAAASQPHPYRPIASLVSYAPSNVPLSLQIISE